MVNPDGSVTGVYCHSDGYLSGVGADLLKTFNTLEKVTELVALGDLSCLYENLNPLPTAIGRRQAEGLVIAAESHSFDSPQRNVTVAYHRDRGEDFNQRIWPSVESWEQRGQHEEYNYLFKGGKWFVLSMHISGGKEVFELNEDLIKLDSEGEESDY